jgi:hypothetical protein
MASPTLNTSKEGFYDLVVHGDVAGIEGVRRALCEWQDWMGHVDAGKMACLDRYIGYYHPYATSHDELDADLALQEEVRNVARAVAMRWESCVQATFPDSMPHYARRDRITKTRESRSSIHWNPMVSVFSIIQTAKGRVHQDCPGEWFVIEGRSYG